MRYNNENFICEFEKIIKNASPGKILFVSGSDPDRYGYKSAIDKLGYKTVAFNDFEPCPEISSVQKAVKLFENEGCDLIAAVGGGSAIDVAKAVKYYSKADVDIVAVPTTAGTGAEVTRFSVLYNNGDKESVSDYSIIPDYAVFDYRTLASLPQFQKKVTALDAFCHCVEAFWSLNADDESRNYSRQGLELFNKNFNSYIQNDPETYSKMMKCSELAGRAINIARTAAPHAMSYKLHKLKGFAHGQAIAVCLAYIWKYMEQNNNSSDVKKLLADTESMTGFTSDSFALLLRDLGLCNDLNVTKSEFDECVSGVNIERMSNHPMRFDYKDVENIYRMFLNIV